MDNNNNDNNSPTTPNSNQQQQTTILRRGVKSLEKITTTITNAANTAVDEAFTISPGNTNTNNRSRANTANSSGGSAVMQYSPPVVHDDDYDDDEDDDDDSYQYLPHDDSAHFLDNEGYEESSADVLILNALAPGEQQYKDKSKVGQFDLCGSMWKRRGGLGRNAERNWVMRCFTLHGPILCYHEESTIELVTNHSKPRARLNLSKIETIAEMHSKQKPGLPSQDLLTINIYDPIVHAKRKWEMCCTSKEQQLTWYKAINAYDGKRVGGGGGGSSSERIGELSPAVKRSYQMPDLSHDRPPSSSRGVPTSDDVELIARAAAKAVEIMMNEKQQQQQAKQSLLSYSSITIGLMIVGLNVAIYLVRNGTEQAYKMTTFLMNAFVLYVAYNNKAASSSPRGPKARAALAKSKKKNVSHSPSSAQQQQRQQQQKQQLSTGKTIPRAPPMKDSALERVLQTNGPNSAESIRAYANAPTDSVEVTPHTYANTDASTFQLRVGPNYKRNKQKAPSGRALYDLISMDFVYADAPLKNTSDKFVVPSIPGITDVSTGHAHIPPMLIVNTWLPGEEPSMFAKNAADGGETYSIPMIFALSKDTLEQLKDIDTASPGVKLLSEWCKRAENEPDFRGRFKCMGMIENIESTGVPKFIQGYNGKPALVTKSGSFKRHENYIEFTINVNMWAFLAKKGLHTLVPTFPDFIFNIGLTIEARKDEEMPEVLLGGCRLMNLDPDRAVVDGVDDVEI